MTKQAEARADAGLLTLMQAAEYLNVTEPWMRRAVGERRIAYVKLGKLLYFKRSDLDAYIEANTITAEDAVIDWS